MADLSYIQATQEVKIAGQDAVGNQVNYVGADANGNMQVKDAADGPVTPGAVAANSILVGAQFNTALPTLTNTQQASLQLDVNGRLIVAAKIITPTGTLTDRSGTATSASTQIMAVNANRKYLFIQNLGNASIYFNFTSAAAVGSGSIELGQFASFIMENNFISTEAVNIIRSGGSNIAFTAKEG